MEDKSVFMEKSIIPSQEELEERLKSTYDLWKSLKDYVMGKYPMGEAQWTYPGQNYGWSYRINDKKRAILYFLPRNRYFRVAFVFGQKAADAVLESDVSPTIKQDLMQAKQYTEGRGIRIDVNGHTDLKDIHTLIDIKLQH